MNVAQKRFFSLFPRYVAFVLIGICLWGPLKAQTQTPNPPPDCGSSQFDNLNINSLIQEGHGWYKNIARLKDNFTINTVTTLNDDVIKGGRHLFEVYQCTWTRYRTLSYRSKNVTGTLNCTIDEVLFIRYNKIGSNENINSYRQRIFHLTCPRLSNIAENVLSDQVTIKSNREVTVNN